MGGKGAKGGQSTNDQIVAMQQQQAAQATAANQERNARLNYGKQNIQQIFEGTPTGSTPLDFSSLANLNPTAAQTANTDPNLALENMWAKAKGMTTNYDLAAPGQRNAVTGAGGYTWARLADDGSGTPQYGLYGPSGDLVNSGSMSDLAATKVYAGGDPSNISSPFGPDFYDKYQQSILDYYLPQEGKQYSDARSSLSYSLARAGQLNSSVAGMDVANLANQDQINRAQIASGADTQTGQLRSTIQNDEQTALNQLYSTEDPSVAANTAQNMVSNASLTKPLLNPAGALFAPITVGVGNALSGFTNPMAYINPNAGGAGSTTASTSSGSSGSGQTVSGYA